MRAGAVLGVFALICALDARENRIQKILARVAEEAEVFRMAAPKVVGEETLRQKVVKKPGRFHPRLGSGAVKPVALQYRTREVVSEYGYSTFKDSPDVLHEFREVISVDGRQVATREKARQTLSLGVTSRDDRLKKRMLETFEKNGLVGAATDFGQLILLFGRRRLGDYKFESAGTGRIGGENVLGVTFRQTAGKEGVTIFQGRKVIRRPLLGTLWVRESDFLPMRIEFTAVREQGDRAVAEDATVDYAMSKHGVLLPASVVHQQRVAGQVVVENNFEYSSFRMFSAETEIKFTEVPAEPPKK